MATFVWSFRDKAVVVNAWGIGLHVEIDQVRCYMCALGSSSKIIMYKPWDSLLDRS